MNVMHALINQLYYNNIIIACTLAVLVFNSRDDGLFLVHQLASHVTSSVAVRARIRYFAIFCGHSYEEFLFNYLESKVTA